MTTLNEFLKQKKEITLERNENFSKNPESARQFYSTKTRVAGRSGVREVLIRDFKLVTDTPPDNAGYDLGVNPPELFLGAVGSCLTHTVLVQAALNDVTLDSVEVEFNGELNLLAGTPVFEDVPKYPHNISYKFFITSSDSKKRVEEIIEIAINKCPLFLLLSTFQPVEGELIFTQI